MAIVTFTQPSFTASEGDDSVPVCISIANGIQLARTIVVTLTTADQSAQGIYTMLICVFACVHVAYIAL